MKKQKRPMPKTPSAEPEPNPMDAMKELAMQGGGAPTPPMPKMPPPPVAKKGGKKGKDFGFTPSK